MPCPHRSYCAARWPTAALLAGWLGACAIVSTPQGGPLDRTGPALDTLASSPNFQLGYRPETIELTFDEYVVLRNATRDVVLTPTPAAGRPSFRQRGRRVTVDFTDVTFRDSTTYQLQFGNAIQDLNEGNPAADLRYVWSTGEFLDSLTVGGRVVAALDATPLPGALVGLYRDLSDTALTRAAPDYFARADSTGRFALDYLAPGRYQVAALADDNGNFRLNQGTEAVAFLEAPVVLAPGRPVEPLLLRASVELAPLRVVRAEQLYPGLVRLTLNRAAAPGIEVEGLPGRVVARYETADSLSVAYEPPLDSLAQLVIRYRGEVDTARFRKTVSAVPPPLAPRGQARALPGEPGLAFEFSDGLAAIDPTAIAVTVDSTPVGSGTFAIDSTDRRRLLWRYPSDTVRAYGLAFAPDALQGFAGQTLRDTFRLTVSPRRAREYGELTLALESLRRDVGYSFELVDGQGAVERRLRLQAASATDPDIDTPVPPAGVDSAGTSEPRPADTPPRDSLAQTPSPPSDSLSATQGRDYRSVRWVVARIPPGAYELAITVDTDGDGRYSVGDRRLGRQPERVVRIPLEQVRADWTLEQRVAVGGR